jgi:hypothetical protein
VIMGLGISRVAVVESGVRWRTLHVR